MDIRLMELRRWIQILCVLPVLQDFLDFRVTSMQCPADTHYLTNEGGHEKCCVKCLAGERVKHHCSAGQNDTTSCEPCKEGTYQPVANGEMRCRTCGKQYQANRKFLKPCTRFQNQEYGDCYESFYHNKGLDVCRKCTSCPKGYGVKKECTKDSDTQCEEGKCGVGTYSDRDSYTQKCMQCTACRSDEEMYKECTSTSNYECRPKIATKPQVPTREILISTLVGLASTTNHPGNRPTDSGREAGRSWVMPFFIAAMVLLLILFLAFVVGVSIWCYIHSRNRQENVILQAEDPQVLQRLKLVDDVESARIPNESRYDRHILPDVRPGRMRENGMMLRDVSHDIIEELANFLNPTSPPSNWRKVASMLDFPWNVINNLALCPTTATQQLLQRWGTKRDSTVYKLYLTLKDIGRDDAAEVLERLLIQPVPSCPKSV